VLALPAGIAYRERLIAIVFGVTLVTLVTQALPFKRFLTWLGVAQNAGDVEADQCRAVLIGARRGQAELDSLLTAGLISRHEHAEEWASFQRDIIDAEKVLRRIGDDPHASVSRPSVLAARKAAILDAARRGLISERTAALNVATLDKEILAAAAHQHHSPGKEES
jgi:CPA1 family monovalent cation:H+ antiporter